MSELGSPNDPDSSKEAPPHPLANNYPYQPLKSDPSTISIRLLTILPPRRDGDLECGIECTLSHVSLSSNPTYEALSYTWGSPQNPREISLDEVDFPITENLFKALLHLRSHDGPRTIWIDAICINQAGVEERNEQVKLMGSIYARAQKVVVWLGEESDFSTYGITFAQELCDKGENKDELVKILKSPDAAFRFRALGNVLNREYWDRIWVVQETFFAQQAVVKCGPASIEWTDLIRAQKVLTDNLIDFRENIEVCRDIVWLGTVGWGGPRSLAPRNPDKQQGGNDLESVLIWHQYKKATDPRDKIYGLLNLVEKDEAALIKVDYQQTVKQVYASAVRAIIQKSQSLNIISCFITGDDNPHGLPSWIPDFSSESSRPLDISEHSMLGSEAGGPLSANQFCFHVDDVLEAQGICIDTVSNLAEPCHHPGSHDVDTPFKALDAWAELHVSLKGTSIEQADSFCKCIFWDPDLEALYRDKFEYADFLLQDEYRSRFRAVLQRAASYGISKADHGLLQNITEGLSHQTYNDASVDSFTSTFSGRRFVVGMGGIIAMVPGETQLGDLMCIILGHQLPLILRKMNDRGTKEAFKLIGEAVVDGYMTGKGIKELHDGKWKARSFCLH